MFRQACNAITYVFTGLVILFVGVVINLVGPGVANASLCHVTTTGNPNTATLTEIMNDGSSNDYGTKAIDCGGNNKEFSPLTDDLSLNILDNRLGFDNLSDTVGGAGGNYTLDALIWRDDLGFPVDGFIVFNSFKLTASFDLAAAMIEKSDFTSGRNADLSSFIKFDTTGWKIPANGGFVVDYQVAHVPLPAALPLFGTGLGILGFLGWRRRRKAQTV